MRQQVPGLVLMVGCGRRAWAAFAVREPGWIPDGYWLSALQSFEPSATPDGDLLDSIVATYTGPNGGRWQAGKLTLDDAGNPARWDPSVTVLAWLDGQRAFRLEGHGPDLAALVRVGANVDR